MITICHLAKGLMFAKLIEIEKRANGIYNVPFAKQSNIVGSPSVSIPFATSEQFFYGDPETLSRVYENLVIVYRAINYRAENLARLPLKIVQVQKDGSETDVSTRDNLTKLLKPSAFFSYYDFYYQSSCLLDLQGELFWHIERDERGRILQFFNDWRSQEVKVLGDPQKLISGYERSRNGQIVNIPFEDVFYIYYFNPFNILRGMSPLQASRQNVILSLNSLTFLRNFFKQGMFPGATAETDQQLSEPVFERTRTTLQNLYGSVENMHKIALLEGGLKLNMIDKMSLNESQILPLLDMNDQKIATTYGVPLELLNMGKGGNSLSKESITAARKQFWDDTMVPYSEKFLGEINKDLVPQLTRLENVVVKHDFSKVEVLQEDVNQKAERFFKGFEKGAVSPNEIRKQVYNLAKDDDPAMDQFYLPANVLRIGSLDEPPAKDLKTINEEKRLEKIYKTQENLQQKHIPRFENAMIKFFNQQEAAVLNRFDARFPTARSFKKWQDDTKQNDPDHIVSATFNEAEWDKILAAILTPLTIAAAFSGAQVYFSEAELNLFGIDPTALSLIGDRVVNFSKINDTTKFAIRDTLQAGLAAGEDIPALRNRVMSVFDTATASRAQLIAQTEAVGSINSGNLIGAKRAGYRFKTWITSRDEKVRATHRTVDNVTVPIDAEFPLPADYTGISRHYCSDFRERCFLLFKNKR